MKRWRRSFLANFGALALATTAIAAEDGGQPAAWAQRALGARSASLGRAVSALAEDPYAAQVNPALLATLQDAQLASQAALLPDGQTLNFVGLGRPMAQGSDWAWGLSYAQYSVSQPLERRKANTPSPDTTFGESASLSRAGLAVWTLERSLAVGADFKLYSQALGDANGGGISGDLGVFWHGGSWMDAALVLEDPLSKLGWSTSAAETLPLQGRVGGTLRPLDDRQLLALVLEGQFSQVQAAKAHAGLELALPVQWSVALRSAPAKPGQGDAASHGLALRAGYDDGQWAAGLGLRGWIYGALLGLDYAFASDAAAAGQFQHRFSLNLGFDL